jgi:hypothetical protein
VATLQYIEETRSHDASPWAMRLAGVAGSTFGALGGVALVLEIGPVDRFAEVRQLIAWTGLDPRVDESGDGTITRGISHRGNAHLRAILFPLVLAAMQHHPRIADFVAAKVAQGTPKKVALVAGAAKLLRIVFAILVSQKPYHADHEQCRAQERAATRQAARSQDSHTAAPQPQSLDAPVSAKERRRRKIANINAVAQPSRECEVRPQGEQRATAPPTLVTTT